MELKKSRVLVTGAGGFIGSHLAERLLHEGADVRAMVRYNSQGGWGWLENSPFNREMEIIPGDIRDFDNVARAMKGIDVVFHLAALIGIPYSYVSPLAYLKVNIEGTYNVLQAARQENVSFVVQTSTSEVYGTAREVPISEAHPLQPQSPYSATKISADSVALSFHLSYGLPVVIIRPFNTYGPRQSARAVLPTIIIQALSGAKEIKLGSLYTTRDMNYVEDTVEGFIRLACCDEALGKTVNVCSTSEASISEIAELVLEVSGIRAAITTDHNRVRPAASEVERLLGDNSLLNKLTGWVPERSLRDGIERTVAWFRDKENMSRYKPNLYNI